MNQMVHLLVKMHFPPMQEYGQTSFYARKIYRYY